METQLSVRMPAELRSELEAAAAADRRPVTALARNVLLDYVASRATRTERAGEQR